MTKMATMPIYGKDPLKTFLSGIGGPITRKLDMLHQWLQPFHSLFKWWPLDDIDLFKGKVKFCNQRFSMGKSEDIGFIKKLLHHSGLKIGI